MNTGGAGLVSDWGTCDGVGAAEGTVLSQGQLVGAVMRVPCEAGCGLGFLGRPSGARGGRGGGPCCRGSRMRTTENGGGALRRGSGHSPQDSPSRNVDPQPLAVSVSSPGPLRPRDWKRRICARLPSPSERFSSGLTRPQVSALTPVRAGVPPVRGGDRVLPARGGPYDVLRSPVRRRAFRSRESVPRVRLLAHSTLHV